MSLSDSIQTAVLLVAFLSLALSVFISWRSLRLATHTLEKMDRDFAVQRVNDSLSSANALLEVVAEFKGQIMPYATEKEFDRDYLIDAEIKVHALIERARVKILLLASSTSDPAIPAETGPASDEHILTREADFMYGAMMGVYLTMIGDGRTGYEALSNEPTKMKTTIVNQMLSWSANAQLSEEQKALKRLRYVGENASATSTIDASNWALSVLDDAQEQFVNALKVSHSSRRKDFMVSR